MKFSWLVLFAVCAGSAACELQEVQLAETDDVVVAEVVLRTGSSTQLAWLHRTRGSTAHSPTVPDALVRVRAARGDSVSFVAASDTACILMRDDTEPGTHGSCYTTVANAITIRPGETYHLSVRLPDGRELVGTTTVPGDFRLLRPTSGICSVPPLTPLNVEWTSAPGTWVYASEISMRGIRAALEPHNLTVNRDPLRLFGLSLSARDTSIVLPGEFGLFDRFDDNLTEALAFMQQGLPFGVIADVVVAAADRNYVNWERGGNFNPSGPIRVPSVHGAGTGVFGALVPKSFQVRAGDENRVAC